MIAGCGCPSTDRKVVNSGKRLRAYVGIDEANVSLTSFWIEVSLEAYLTKLKHLLSRCVALVT